MKITGRMPILETIKKYGESEILQLHIPGHKRGMAFKRTGIDIPWEDALKYDTTEVGDIDNLHFPEGAIKEAEELAAEAFGAEKTFFLANGTTAGILAMINAVAREGDSIIIPRNCHKSVFNALILGKIRPIYLFPEIDLDFGVPLYISSESVSKAFDDNPHAVAVLITNPTFYGTCSDLEKIAEEAHKRGKLLLVDEAHGAHFHFSKKLPKSALEAGADIVAQSTHKCLCSMTGSSMLHVRSINKIDIDRLKFFLQTFQTSSPNHLLLASLDAARALIQTESGLEMLDTAIESAKRLRAKLKNLSGIKVLGEEFSEKNDLVMLDPLRLTVNFKDLGISGTKIEKILKENWRIQVELSDIINIVAVFTMADDEMVFEKVFNALSDISKNSDISSNKERFINSQVFESNNFKKVMEPWEAFESKKDIVKIEDSIGRISGEMLIPYPPGIPIILPGEIISSDFVEFINECNNFNIKINCSLCSSTGNISVIKK